MWNCQLFAKVCLVLMMYERFQQTSKWKNGRNVRWHPAIQTECTTTTTCLPARWVGEDRGDLAKRIFAFYSNTMHMHNCLPLYIFTRNLTTTSIICFRRTFSILTFIFLFFPVFCSIKFNCFLRSLFSFSNLSTSFWYFVWEKKRNLP